MLRAGEDEAEIILKLNDDLFAAKRLGSIEEMWFKSSLDGLDIQSWILKPPDFDAEKKYPPCAGDSWWPHGRYRR